MDNCGVGPGPQGDISFPGHVVQTIPESPDLTSPGTPLVVWQTPFKEEQGLRRASQDPHTNPRMTTPSSLRPQHSEVPISTR